MQDINNENYTACAESKPFKHWYDKFNSFVEDSKTIYGDLFDFWLSFLNIIEIILCLITATRTGNWPLYISALEEVVPWMFAYDRQNYARYLIPHLDDMKSLEEKHKDVYDEFCRGGFVVHLSDSNAFSSIEADKAIEMTINKDCKTTGGYTGFISNIAATQRWVLNNQRRSLYKSILQDLTSYSPKGNKHVDLHESRINHDTKDVEEVMNLFENSIQNPWSGGTLRSISTGVIASEAIKNDLLKAKDIGSKAAKSFKNRLTEVGGKQFHDPIEKIKMKTFSNLEKNMTSSKKRETSVACSASLFARLSIIANIAMSICVMHYAIP